MKNLKFTKGNSLFLALLLGSILLLLIFICVATFSGAWPGSDVSAQILSALAGAVVTAMITLFLLLGQTANEEKRDKNAKIFEEKLRIYNEFLQKLCSVVSDMSIDKKEEIELEFQVAQIAMHTSAQSINKISEQVSTIIRGIKNGENKNGEMLTELFEIADTFYEELYGAENAPDKSRFPTIENFRAILIPKEKINDYENTQRQAVIDSLQGEERLTLTDRTKLLKAKIHNIGSKQWIYGRTTLVHEFYTDVDPGTNSYYSSQNQIAIDLVPDTSANIYRLTIFVRTWDLERIKSIAGAIWPDRTFKPWPEDEPCRLLYKEFPLYEKDDVIVREIETLLAQVKEYRDKTYPLK